MARTAVIKLGGVDYTVHAFNMGELRRVATIFNKAKANGGGEGVEVAFDVLRIAFERAEPKADVETVEPDGFDEVIAACLAKNPDSRLSSGEAMAQLLYPLARRKSVVPPVQAQPKAAVTSSLRDRASRLLRSA